MSTNRLKVIMAQIFPIWLALTDGAAVASKENKEFHTYGIANGES